MVSQKDLLAKWSKNVNADNLEDTVSAIKKALAGYKKFPASVKVAYYVHGSYAHQTNVQHYNPVDLIIELTSVIGSSKDKADPFRGKNYSFDNFRADIFQSMKNAFGETAVSQGNSTIHVDGSGTRMPANILVCFKYKLFIRHGRDEVEKVGVAFYPKGNDKLVLNFPKQHQSYETIKDKGSIGQFLPMVRVFKNMRDRMVELGYIKARQAPSYFVESFICNAPSGMFTVNYENTIADLLDFWKKNAWRNYLTIDGFRTLWGDYPQSWNIEDAKAFLEAVRKAGADATFWEETSDQ